MTLCFTEIFLILSVIQPVYSSYILQTPCIDEFYTPEARCAWRWFRRVCSYYLVKHEQCCKGYGGSGCDIPKCHGGAVENSCNVNEGWVKLQDDTIITNSGGTCSEPFTCTDCNTGYYVSVENDGTCSACKHIDNCNIPSCTNYDDTVCDWCDGELDRDAPGYNVFTGKPDNKQCLRACSWRDGYRCFPGTCGGDMLYPDDCTCAPGFTGYNCATVKDDNPPAILIQSLILEGDGDVTKLIADIPLANGKFWSNEDQWLTAELNASSFYKPTIDSQNVPSYISSYSIGIEDITLTATLTRGGDQSRWITSGDCSYKERCETTSKTDLKQTPWNTILQGGFPSPFRHMDLITFMMSTTNGGLIKYIDREANAENTYYLNGVTVTNTLEIGFDFYSPVHCYETSHTCTQDSLTVQDFIRLSQADVTWDGWTDNDAGLMKYVVTLKYLAVKDQNNPILEETHVVSETTLNSDDVSTIVTFDDPGPYSVEITAFDKADNFKTSRRIVLYDNISVVEKMDPVPKVVQANEFSWINVDSMLIEVNWVGRYINKQHHTHGWLNEVKDNPEVSPDLDDTSGRSLRGVDALYNILGIVYFEIGYTTILDGQTSLVNFEEVPKEFFDLQKKIYNDIDLIDGKRLTFTIRAYDTLDHYAEDNVTVTIDLSPPVIENLWLTKGDYVNISLHNVLELNDITIEWEVQDEQSGIYELEWRIFDNFTNTDVQHGHSFESLQGGDSQTMQQCEEKYEDYPRGHNCYCSPFNGCYHRHFQIKPQVTETGTDGIHSSKNIGVHDYDYFIEITAINNARLKTVATYKFTIDISPPHEGTVHDGILGQPEVDFQQSLDLHAHWDDFFDRESSVWFYLYGFHTECLLAEDFDVHEQNEKISRTFEKSASFTAPSFGQYFITVVAVNHALGVSQPVCSDGIIIDTTHATIAEVVVKDAVTVQSVVKDETTGEIYVVNRHRELQQVIDPPQDCIDKALPVSNEEIQLLPHKRNMNGIKTTISLQNCSFFTDLNNNLLSFITSSSHLEVSWNVSVGVAGLSDMEIGISSEESDIPDIMAFETTHGHQHKKLYHPNIFNGEHFFIVIRTITKSAVTDIKNIGPFVLDGSKPNFQGRISLSVESEQNQSYIVASWDKDSFVDHGDPHPLRYEIAIGSSKNIADILPFQSIKRGGSCDHTNGQTCAAVSTDMLPWQLHTLQTYYVAIKATDTVGMFVVAWSDKYQHSVMKASAGIVYDIDIDSNKTLVDIDDIDYQTETHRLSARWFGFEHPYEDIHFTVCIVNMAMPDEKIICEVADNMKKHTFSGLSLEIYQTYSFMVIGETSGGNVSALSNGVTLVVENDTLDGVTIHDGLPCNVDFAEDFNAERSHHSEDKRLQCTEDIEFQSSTNRLQAYWYIESEKAPIISDVYWAIEERAPVVEYWKVHKEFEHLRTKVHSFEDTVLSLTPGRRYRVELKFCAGPFCFIPVKSSGVTIIPNPPVPGAITVQYMAPQKQIIVSLGHFKDPDIESLDEALTVMDHYEWAIADNSIDTKLLTKWRRAENVNSFVDKVTFAIDLEGDVKFTKCWAISVKGYNKVGRSSMISTDVKNCSDIKEVKPSIVIDAIGESTVDEHIGKPIYLEENAIWPLPDVDYTPYNNILSAVWPTLRHGAYTWTIVTVRDDDVTILYNNPLEINLQDLCSHPDSVKCGYTDLNYINVHFKEGELTHGYRYVVCVHANATSLHHERWTQELPEVNNCSDGVTVDLTPPLTGDVWIGNSKDVRFQTSISELSVNWISFIDVEEEGYAVHSSGITGYELTIGTTERGVDVIPPTMVGLTNHKMFHDLHLVNGHTYFATVRGYDFTGQSSVSYSEGVTIDTTPPVISNSRITVQSRHITSTKYVEACWTGLFSDVESGISHYSWSIGTQSGFDNIMTYMDTEDECSNTEANSQLSLREGHAYIINVKAYNNAGLFSVASSWAFIVDSSEPETGDVYDGSKLTDTEYIDLDYIDTTSSVHVRWKGFHDPHTPIKEYFVSLGSCQGCEDIRQSQPNGLQEYAELKYLRLAEGIKYFVTVTACNTADLCSSATSDGFIIDTTAPNRGYVLDGTLAHDIQYQAARTYIGCKWYGFNDPQSKISKYVWRAGTSKGADDIIAPTDCHNLQEAFIYDLAYDLPLNVRIYCTIRAYNNAGKYVESSSNGFLVDGTPPVFDKPLALSRIGSIKDGTSILRSLIRVNWAVSDHESYIESQHLSISSHIGGDFNLSSVQVEGIVRDYTFTNLDLHDGSYYDIKLTSCNGVKLCTDSILQDVLVDSSPPTQGTFAINTDHAARLKRQPDLWMTWTPISISLAWVGFEDAHSGIESYLINIGSQYMGNDLNKFEGEPYVISHSSSATFYEDGLVQTYKLSTKPLSKHSSVFISISARNSVGLLSGILHAEFNLLFGGILEIVRRCERHTCYGHCVCAAEGQLCLANDNTCVDTSSDGNDNTLIEVQDIIDVTFPSDNQIITTSPVNTMLAAKWSVKTIQGMQPKWYECSVGESSFDTPQGIFHETEDRVWHDAGQNTECVFTLQRGKSLVEGEKYSVFVRVWYNQKTFAVFRSPGVTIYSTLPELSIILGRNVQEIIQGSTKDTDFVTLNTKVRADWAGKFKNSGNTILRYHLYISTTPGGHDVYTLSTNIASDVTSFNITGLNLEEDTKYYTVVQAYNKAGLHSTAVSDGFMLDLHPPLPGIVLDGKTLVDINVSNDSHRLSAFWYGFSDLQSGIISYDFCVSSSESSSDCDIFPMTSAGISLSKTYYSPTPFKEGYSMFSKVRAHDAVGHMSEIVSTNGLKIDTSPPLIMEVGKCSNNVVIDHSFEDASPFICDESDGGSWFISSDRCVQVEESSTAHNGNAFAVIQSSIAQMITVGYTGRYRLTMFTSTLASAALRLSSVEGYVSVNGEKHLFSLYEKPSSDLYTWQKHTFFFDIYGNELLLSIGTLRENSAFALDDVTLQFCGDPLLTSSDKKGHVNANTEFVHDWSSVHADWAFIDPESDITEYIWAIGTVEGGAQIQTFRSIGRQSYGKAEALQLEHNTEVFVTVVAINEAELQTVSYSPPIKIDLTPPVFRYVNDGEVPGEDVDFQSDLSLTIHWDVYDLESDIIGCSWGLGIAPGDTSLQNFTHTVVNISLNSANKIFEKSPNRTIFSTVKCENGAGLTKTMSSDGIKILQFPPSVDGVILQLITTSLTQYLPRESYHGNSSEIRFRWIGFGEHNSVDSFEVHLSGNNVEMSEIVPSTSSGYNYASFMGLDLEDGEYNISVTAINELRMHSERVSKAFYLLTKAPKLTDEPMNTTWIKSASKARTSWNNVFDSDHPMFFEVTVSLAENGQGDVIQWHETNKTFTDIFINPDDILNKVFSIDISVRAISYSGLYAIRHDNFQVNTLL